MHCDFLSWCSLRQPNGGLNSGPKSANIVTDALSFKQVYIVQIVSTVCVLILVGFLFLVDLVLMYRVSVLNHDFANILDDSEF